MTSLIRTISKRLLLPLLLKTKITANTLTIGNFLTFRLGAVVCFLLGRGFAGLLFCGLSDVVDHLDGELARATAKSSKLGRWLDISLDWLWLLLLILAIGVGYGCLFIATVALIAIVFSNYLEYSSGMIAKCELKWILSIPFLIVVGVLSNQMYWAMLVIMVTQWIRTAVLFRRVLCIMQSF